LGGVAQLIVAGLPVGLGDFSQAAQRLDSRLAAALMSIPSAKGVEIGLGFESAARRGSEVHDEIFYDASRGGPGKGFYRRTNAAGGIEGGMSNGEDIIARIACKPISTLNKPLRTVDLSDKQATEAMVERSDNCIVPAFAVICEAVAAIELTTAFLTKFGGDSMRELDTRYQAYLDAPY
jgi:chorismate synthase